MQHESIHDRKRKIDTTDSHVSTEYPETIPTFVLPEEKILFLQIIDDYPYNHLVTIDPVQDKIIYEDLLEFERSRVTIQMNNYEPESLYTLYEGNIARPERHVAWLEFIRHISVGKNPDKSEYFLLNREDCHKIQNARWFVYFCLR